MPDLSLLKKLSEFFVKLVLPSTDRQFSNYKVFDALWVCSLLLNNVCSFEILGTIGIKMVLVLRSIDFIKFGLADA